MKIGSKRRALAAASTALFAVVLAVAVAGRSCTGETRGPISTVQAFLEARETGDRELMLEYLGPATRARLEEWARDLTQLAGGDRRYSAVEMLKGLKDVPMPEDLELVSSANGRAEVAVVVNGQRLAVIPLVDTASGWRIELMEHAADPMPTTP